jgi:hypothetical protein
MRQSRVEFADIRSDQAWPISETILSINCSTEERCPGDSSESEKVELSNELTLPPSLYTDKLDRLSLYNNSDLELTWILIYELTTKWIQRNRVEGLRIHGCRLYDKVILLQATGSRVLYESSAWDTSGLRRLGWLHAPRTVSQVMPWSASTRVNSTDRTKNSLLVVLPCWKQHVVMSN